MEWGVQRDLRNAEERWNSKEVPVLWWLGWRGDDRDDVGGEDLFQDDQTTAGGTSRRRRPTNDRVVNGVQEWFLLMICWKVPSST